MGKKQKGKHGNPTKETPQRVCGTSWRGEILVRASSHLSNSHALDLLQDRLSMPDEPPPMYPLNLQGAVQSSHRLAPNTLFNRRATRHRRPDRDIENATQKRHEKLTVNQ